MQRLREILEAVFPGGCLLKGPRIEEKGRIFSIKPGAGEAAIGMKLAPLRKRWPNGKGICDGVFVCRSAERNHLVVTLVELKGSDVTKAMTQIEDSYQLLCKGSNPFLQIHSGQVREAARALNLRGHGKGVLGVIVGRTGLSLEQKKKKILWEKHRLRIWSVTGRLRAITCAELARKFAGTN